MCNDCVPPSTAASAWIGRARDIVHRLWAGRKFPSSLRMEPHKPSALVLAPKRSFITRCQILRAARYFAISSKKSLCVEEKTEAGAELVDVKAASPRLPRLPRRHRA